MSDEGSCAEASGATSPGMVAECLLAKRRYEVSDMAISDPPFSFPVADGDPDDLPRTLRREREAREREARERQARERAATMPAGYHSFVPPFGDAPSASAGTVTRLDLPFLHLMAFFLKAVFAAVPALLVLCAMIWGAAHAVLAWYPELVKMQILILFPPG